jgi:hypothetical protein
MTYDATRDSEQLRYLDALTSAFILRYKGSSKPADQRRTLILLTGGMGSQLLQATTPYQDGGPANQTFSYDTVWLTLDTLLGDALQLQMTEAGGVNLDRNNQIIIANDEVDFFGVKPYSTFTDWCDLQGIDWFVYGWDWRRPVDVMASFLLNQFLPRFQTAVQLATGADPLKNLVLVGHSEGGMLLTVALSQPNGILGGLTSAITVCSPFYGYDGQLPRWFNGESYLNYLGEQDIIETISSFQGCYCLNYMDINTYTNNAALFAADAAYPLLDYPSKDATNPATDVDPYVYTATRYSTADGFNAAYLNNGFKVYQTIAAGPAPDYRNLFYNIRGVQATNDTVGGITWATLPPGYTPGTSFQPITDDSTLVPGDDTQPAWTARLLGLPDAQCITVEGDIHHMFMMEYPQTQDAIGGILGLPPIPLEKLLLAKRSSSPSTLVPAASTTDALAFVRSLQGLRTPDRFATKLAVDAALAKTTLGGLVGVARRVLMDILKRPGHARRPGTTPPDRRTP